MVMKNHLIKTAAAVPRLKVGDIKHNVEEIRRIIEDKTHRFLFGWRICREKWRLDLLHGTGEI